METYAELMTKSTQLFTDVKVILEKTDATAEDLAKVQPMLDDAKAMRGRAVQLKDVEAHLSDMATRTEKEQQPEADKSKEPRKDPTQFKDFNEFLKAAWWSMHPENRAGQDKRLQKFIDRDEEADSKKDMTGNVGASGGYLIPSEELTTLLSVNPEDDIVQPRATIIRMRRRQIGIPVLDQTGTTSGVAHWFGGFLFYYGEEAGLKTEKDFKFRKITLTAHKLFGYTRASDELVDDEAVGLGDFIASPLGFAGGVKWMRDYQFLRGTGAGTPLGIINAGATISVAAQAAPPAPASFFTDLVNMIEAFLPSGRGMWVLNHRHMSDLMLMNGPTGNASYLWGNAVAGQPATLLGYPFKFTEKLPAPGSAGSALLADFRYYLVGDRQAATIESTKYDRWAYDETSWRVVDRHDGQPWLSAPLTLQDGSTQVSPFVILGAKST